MKRAGFTIIEILIAIVVLVLGITGILALFPTAIDSGNKTVEDSYSAAVTQSVVDAVAVGLRESRYSFPSSGGPIYTYFIFNHDGVIDAAPSKPADYGNGTDEMWSKDYCVLLPVCSVDDSATPNTTSANEPVFIYPVPSQGSAGFPGADPEQRAPANLGTRGFQDNFAPGAWVYTTVDDTPALWVSRTFRLGRYREGSNMPDGMEAGDIRLEYRGEDLVDPNLTVTESNLIALDPYPGYSFAFAIKRARVDTTDDGQITDADGFSSSLYELRVMIFKGFNQEEADRLTPNGGVPTGGGSPTVPKTNVPIKQFITLIST